MAGNEFQASQTRRVQSAESTLKRLLKGPVVKEPERPVLGPHASESDRMLGELVYRVQKLENQNSLVLKVVWRTSAALIGLVVSGPLKDWAAAVIHILGG